jgi:hypothetical protein
LISSIVWLDHDDEQQQKMREAIQLFRDEGAIDELGLGRIRDALSERMFPGTSVLWGRARYLLIVPWFFQALESGKGSPGDADERSRRLFRKIASELKGSGGGQFVTGVIGGQVRDAIQTPDMAIWAGLQKWGIRTTPGSRAQSRRDAVAKSLSKVSIADDVEPRSSIWHPRLPAAPADFPDGLSFDLTPREADFLFALMTDPEMSIDEWTQSRADSLFPPLLKAKPDSGFEDCEAPWDLPKSVLKLASPELREAIHSAGCFSDIARGAHIYYAYLVALQRAPGESSDEVVMLGEQIDTWAEKITTADRLAQLQEWLAGIDNFWALIYSVNDRVVAAERDFIKDWARLCVDLRGELRSTDETRERITAREIQVKHGLARLKVDGSIGRDAPAALPQPMIFRWAYARDIALGIRKGLQQ